MVPDRLLTGTTNDAYRSDCVSLRAAAASVPPDGNERYAGAGEVWLLKRESLGTRMLLDIQKSAAGDRKVTLVGNTVPVTERMRRQPPELLVLGITATDQPWWPRIAADFRAYPACRTMVVTDQGRPSTFLQIYFGADSFGTDDGSAGYGWSAGFDLQIGPPNAIRRGSYHYVPVAVPRSRTDNFRAFGSPEDGKGWLQGKNRPGDDVLRVAMQANGEVKTDPQAIDARVEILVVTNDRLPLSGGKYSQEDEFRSIKDEVEKWAEENGLSKAVRVTSIPAEKYDPETVYLIIDIIVSNGKGGTIIITHGNPRARNYLIHGMPVLGNPRKELLELRFKANEYRVKVFSCAEGVTTVHDGLYLSFLERLSMWLGEMKEDPQQLRTFILEAIKTQGGTLR